MRKTLWISRKHLQPTKYLPQFPIWYQYSPCVLGAALGDATTQTLPAQPGGGRGVGQVNFHSCFASALCHLTLPWIMAGKPFKEGGRGESGNGRDV